MGSAVISLNNACLAFAYKCSCWQVLNTPSRAMPITDGDHTSGPFTRGKGISGGPPQTQALSAALLPRGRCLQQVGTHLLAARGHGLACSQFLFRRRLWKMEARLPVPLLMSRERFEPTEWALTKQASAHTVVSGSFNSFSFDPLRPLKLWALGPTDGVGKYKNT